MKDERILQAAAKYCLAVMIIVVFIGIAVSYRDSGLNRQSGEPSPIATPTITAVPTRMTYSEEEIRRIHADIESGWSVWNVLLTEEKEQLERELTDSCIVIRRPKSETKMELTEENLLKRTIRLTVSGDGAEEVLPVSVLRVRGEQYYIGVPAQMFAEADPKTVSRESETQPVNEDLVMNLEMLAGAEQGKTVLLTLDDYYLPEVHETEEYFILTLKKPREKARKIVVIDAGHGGRDPGACAESNTVRESVINLKIVLYLKEYLDADPEITAYYTRVDDSYPTLQERVELANGVDADLFLSIHCNSADSARRSGTEVMYNAEQGVGEPFNSRSLALLCLNQLSEALGTRAAGIIKRPELHIVRRAVMPVALLETAYLSNKEERSILKDEERLRAAGASVYRSILEAYEKLEQEGMLK